MLDESLFSKAGEFKAKIESLKQLLKKESDLHKHYKSETDRLNEVIRLLKKQAFASFPRFTPLVGGKPC